MKKTQQINKEFDSRWQGKIIYQTLNYGMEHECKNEIKSFIHQLRHDDLQSIREDLKQIMNRCKTERGLGVALANYLSHLSIENIQ